MNTNFKLGDLLYRRKGIVDHTAVYIGGNKVLHSSPAKGVEVLSVDDYSVGRKIRVISTSIENQFLLSERIRTILEIDPSYNILTSNCEHIAHFLISGRSQSPQKQIVIAATIISGVIAWKSGSKYWPLIAILSGAASCYVSNRARNYHKEYSPSLDSNLKPILT